MPAPRRILFLGDSYTVGTGILSEQSWPAQLVKRLNRRGANLADPELIAMNGWTTGDLLEALDRNAPAGPFDLVSILIGANNQYQGRAMGEYRMHLAALVERALGWVEHRALRVLVVSIPDWGVSPFAEGRNRSEIGLEIDDFNRVNLEEAGRRGVLYCGITEISRAFADQPETFADYGLHPNAAHYEAWLSKLYPFVNGILGRTTAPLPPQ